MQNTVIMREAEVQPQMTFCSITLQACFQPQSTSAPVFIAHQWLVLCTANLCGIFFPIQLFYASVPQLPKGFLCLKSVFDTVQAATSRDVSSSKTGILRSGDTLSHQLLVAFVARELNESRKGAVKFSVFCESRKIGPP